MGDIHLLVGCNRIFDYIVHLLSFLPQLIVDHDEGVGQKGAGAAANIEKLELVVTKSLSK